MIAFRAVLFRVSPCALLACTGLLLAATPAPASLVMSTFDAGIEGWGLIGDVGIGPGAMWQSSGGNPDGHVRAPDGFNPESAWHFNQIHGTPGATLTGNRSAAYGGAINFDLITQDTSTSRFTAPDVLLTGGGLTLVIDEGILPTTSWATYSVSLLASAGWRVGNLGGPAATEAQMMTVLSNLYEIRIRGNYRTGSDITGMDNVALVAVPEPSMAGLLGVAVTLALLARSRRFPARPTA